MITKMPFKCRCGWTGAGFDLSDADLPDMEDDNFYDESKYEYIWMILSFGIYFGIMIYCAVCFLRDMNNG